MFELGEDGEMRVLRDAYRVGSVDIILFSFLIPNDKNHLTLKFPAFAHYRIKTKPRMHLFLIEGLSDKGS